MLKRPLKDHDGVYIPTDDTNIDEVFDCIYAREFKEYLCEILDGKHTYHIFNTYIFIELNGYFSGNFTFFSLLSLKPSKDFSFVFNNIYENKLNEVNEEKEINFMKDMQYVIDIFLNIYKFPNKLIIKPTDEYKNTHTNQEIIDLIQSTGIIRKETQDAQSGYTNFITKNKTTESIIENLPFAYWPFTIIEKNDTMVKLLKCIVNPDSCIEPEPQPKPRSSSMSKTSKRVTLSLSPIEGIAEYIPGSSPKPSPKRSTRRNTSLFDTTRKKYAYKPSTLYKYKLRRFTHGKKRPRK